MNCLQNLHKDLSIETWNLSAETCQLVNNNLCRKLVSLFPLPIIFDDILSAKLSTFFGWSNLSRFFGAYLNLSFCEFDHFTLILWY